VHAQKNVPKTRQRVGETKQPKGAKAEIVLHAIRNQSGEFRLADIERACPGVGR